MEASNMVSTVRLMLISALPVFCQPVSEKAWRILDNGLKDSSGQNRIGAAKALSLLKDDSKAQSALESLLADSSAQVRVAAATSLGKMDARSSAPKIEPLLKDRDPDVVLAARRRAVSIRKSQGVRAVLRGAHQKQEGR